MASTSVNRSRRQWLLGRAHKNIEAHRLPWLVNNDSFVDDCTLCGKCIQACPENIIVKGDGGFPEIDFHRGDCQFCYECASVCVDVNFYPRSKAPWTLKAVISNEVHTHQNTCLVNQSVMCQTCKDFCEFDAITLVQSVGHVARPKVDTALCSGCGACVSACPSQAISMASEGI